MVMSGSVPGGSTSNGQAWCRDYLVDGVIAALRQLLTTRRAKVLHGEALRFASDVLRGVQPDKQKAFAKVPYLLPSRSQKLIPAEQALLAPTWCTRAGELLGDLTMRCGLTAEEVGALEVTLVDPPDGLEPTAGWMA